MDKYADAQSHETTGTPRDFIIRNAHPLLVVRDFVKDRFALEIWKKPRLFLKRKRRLEHCDPGGGNRNDTPSVVYQHHAKLLGPRAIARAF